MKPQLKVLTGERAGHVEVFSKQDISIGRHSSSDLQLDPDRDLDVSARHADIVRRGDKWYARDAGSRNGTLVNGHVITRDTALDDTDQIRLGNDGPVIEVRLVPDGTPDGVKSQAATQPAPRSPSTAVRETGGVPQPVTSTTQRIRVEVRRQTQRLRGVILALFGALIVVAGVFFVQNRRQELRRAGEVAALQARTDSVLQAADAAIEILQGEVAGLATRLRRSQTDVGRLQQQLAAAQRAGTADQIDALTRQLHDATQQLRFQQAAARLDYRGIVDSNQLAVAMIYVEFGSGDVFTGTAFAVRPDGTMLTNRHVVAGEEGTRQPSRIAIKFADSRQVWRARVVALSSEADLAAIKVDIPGGVPIVKTLNERSDTLRQGDPVALIGYPLGTDLPMTGSGTTAIARTSYYAGSVSKVLPELIQVDGYGAEGASGTPIFDRNGEVVAILYGGQEGTGGRVVYGVPSRYAVELLRSISQ